MTLHHTKTMPHFTSFDNVRVAQQLNTRSNQTQRLIFTQSLVDVDSASQGISSLSCDNSAQLDVVNPYFSDGLTTPDGVDEALVQGFDIDSLIGIDMNGRGYFNDALVVNDQMFTAMNESMNGYIAGRHWTEFAESMFGYIDEYLGVGTEAYECTSDGMTKAWNKRETQLCEGAGVCEDLNGDGHVGDAPTGDSCDGENISLSEWLFEKAAEAAEEALKAMGFGSDEEDEESEADPDDCFEKPWEYDQFNVMGGQHQFQAQGSGDPISMDLFAQPQNPFLAVANPVF